MERIFATGNANKAREAGEILKDLDLNLKTLKEAGIDVDIKEDGTSFKENALIKARAIHEITKGAVLADDSGLVVDALGGEPGIYSARYLGEDTPYSYKNSKIIERLKDVPDDKRTARFVCAMAAVLEDGSEIVTEGVMEGRIAYESAGENGFGYDPIFFLPEYGKTSAEISPEEKNAISHRGNALRLMYKELSERL